MTSKNNAVRKCPGCHYRVKAAEGWCAGCGGRLPESLANRVHEAEQALAAARAAAADWLHRHPRISPRELDVVRLVAEGLGDREIAERLGMGYDQVKDQLRQVAARWGCRGRAQIVATAFRLQYLAIEEGSECLTVQE